MLEYSNLKLVELSDWDNLVRDTYERPYSFQQQYGCQNRGIFKISIPCEYTEDNEMNDSIPEVVNGEEKGVKFSVWLSRDPKQYIPETNEFDTKDFDLRLFWHRNFYPDIYTVANDLYNKGLIEKGDYGIDIDW